jgi:hypothetical protein
MQAVWPRRSVWGPRAIDTHLEERKESHVRDYQTLFNRVHLDLGTVSSAVQELPSDERLDRAHIAQHGGRARLETERSVEHQHAVSTLQADQPLTLDGHLQPVYK